MNYTTMHFLCLFGYLAQAEKATWWEEIVDSRFGQIWWEVEYAIFCTCLHNLGLSDQTCFCWNYNTFMTTGRVKGCNYDVCSAVAIPLTMGVLAGIDQAPQCESNTVYVTLQDFDIIIAKGHNKNVHFIIIM